MERQRPRVMERQGPRAIEYQLPRASGHKPWTSAATGHRMSAATGQVQLRLIIRIIFGWCTHDFEGLDNGFVNPENIFERSCFFCNVVSVYMYFNRCICIYILCFSPEESFYDYLLVHAVIDCERSLTYFEPMARWIYLSVTILCAYAISLEMFSVFKIICWCVRSSIVNIVLHALSLEVDEYTCSLQF